MCMDRGRYPQTELAQEFLQRLMKRPFDKLRGNEFAVLVRPFSQDDTEAGGDERGPSRAQRGSLHRAGVRARLGCSATGPASGKQGQAHFLERK